jgi:hypothetical protein
MLRNANLAALFFQLEVEVSEEPQEGRIEICKLRLSLSCIPEILETNNRSYASLRQKTIFFNL